MTQLPYKATFFWLFKRLPGLTAVHVLLLVAVLEVAINRVAVPMLRPPGGVPPAWHTDLDYVGLFSFYFAGTLAVLLLGAQCWQVVRSRGRRRAIAAYAIVGVTALLAAAPLVIDAPAQLSFTLELAFTASVVALVVAGATRGGDLGIRVGLVVVAIPLLLHGAAVVGARFVWPDNTFDGPGVELAHAGVVALCLAALVTPYCFAPRPFSRAVTRPAPVLAAMAAAAIGALLARLWYPSLAKAVGLALGLELAVGQPDPRLAMYLLAAATLVWTLVSCAIAASAARRSVGLGLGLVALGGYAFKWPHHYLLPLLGLALIADAARGVRDDEQAALPIASATPPIADGAWAAYIAQVVQGLGRTLGAVHTLTTRGEAGLASTTIVGEAAGTTVRLRIERIEGSVLGLDVVLGRDFEDGRSATFTMWGIAPRALGVNPPGPPAAPVFKANDPLFDERFKLRGSARAFARVFDDGLRARAVATIDGWIAYWDHESVRYRVFPGRGAPLDHPMPLSDLALGRAATAERLVTVVELLVALAARGVALRAAAAEPTQLA